MNNCPPEEKLGAFLDGELSERESGAVQAHVRACKACANAVAEMSEIDRLGALLRAPDVAREEWGSTWTGIAARVATGKMPVPPSQRQWWHRLPACVRRRPALWAVPAAACLALAVGALLLTGQPDSPQDGPALQCVAEEVEAGQGYAATVSYSPDGEATLITVSPIPKHEEAPPDGSSGKTL